MGYKTASGGRSMMDWSGQDASGTEVVINVSGKEALVAAIEGRLATREGFSVATLNLDHAVKLRRDSAFRRAYGRHSHVVADGNPVVWLARLAGQQVALTPGCELVEPVAGIAARLGVPVALFGSTDASLARAEAVLARRHPGLSVVARIAPPMGFDPAGPEASALIEALAASGARLCFLALGAPKQEIFAARAQVHLPQMGFLSIGAGLDFLSGHQTRAPAWVRILRAEWLWRLALDPRRLARRYGACLAILPGLTWTALRSRARPGGEGRAGHA